MVLDIIHEYDTQIQPHKNTDGKWCKTRSNKEIRYFPFKNRMNLEEKERHSIELLKMALNRVNKPVVSCSFGIDSVLSLYLTRKALIEIGRDPSDIDVIWNDTLNEFPEVRKYAKELRDKWNIRLIITRPKKPLKKVIDDNGGITSDYFTARKGDRRNGKPLSEKCCGTLKHEPMRRAIRENNWDLVINGLRADESRQRLLAALRDGEFFYSASEWKALVVRPILWWTEEDVWNYVVSKDIPYNDLYLKNLIRECPDNLREISDELKAIGIDVEDILNGQLQTVTRLQAIKLEKLGFKIFTPRTGCQMCPIPVKYGYMHWMRLYHPKAYNAMVHNLGYGKVLIEMVPQEVRDEIRELTGIDITTEDAVEHLKEILEAKPCSFDNLEK